MHPISNTDSEALAEPGLAAVGGASLPPPPQASPDGAPRPRWSRWHLAAAIGGGLLVASAAAATVTGLVLTRRNVERTVPGLRLDGKPLGEQAFTTLPQRVHELGERFLDRKVRLRVGREIEIARFRDLGLQVDEATVLTKLRELGHSGDPLRDLQTYLHGRSRGYALQLPVAVDDKKAMDFLMELKDRVDRGPIDARLDLEKHTIAPEKSGYLLRVYDSLVMLQYTARDLSTAATVPGELQLTVAETPPQVRSADLHDLDVSHVIATWETRYSNAAIDNDRTYNLKVGADKLNGYIMRPGQVFSFNGAVGDRTEKEGYRVAPVIQAGELIDGLAGGMCQIASTLHAAAFFAGLDIVRSTPHSRPSSYIPMGLDSTVVWPSVDLKLKNPYDFPIVIHYMVNQGAVKVELLGKQLPYRIAFEREILTETKFPSTARPDTEMPTGQKFNAQEGYPGYRIKRRRYLYTGKWKVDAKNQNRGKPDGLVSRREWDLSYPPTTEIVHVGSGPATLKKKEPPPSHHIPAIPPSAKPLFVITR